MKRKILVTAIVIIGALLPGKNALCQTAQNLPALVDTAYLQKSELICAVTPTTNVHASTIVELPGGKLMAAWFGGTAEGDTDVNIWISSYQNSTWNTPVQIANGRISSTVKYPCWNPVLFYSKEGKLFLFYKVGANTTTWWGMMKVSYDNGVTWSAPITLPTGMLGPIKDKPIELANGTILCPSSTENYDWKVHVEYTNDSAAVWSKTYVDTTSAYSVIQPTLLRYSPVQLQMLCRSKSGLIIQNWSQDNGTTWGNFTATTVPNNNSGIDAVTLKNGLQVLVYNPLGYNGTTSYRYKLNVAISSDGINWKDIYVLENGPVGVGTQYEFSYPAVIQTSDGLVHITYTWKRLNIKHVVLNITGCGPHLSVDSSLALKGDTLVAKPGYANYNWINCVNSNSVSSGSSNELVPASYGTYSVIVEDTNWCSRLSPCVQYFPASVANYTEDNAGIKLFPNPASDFTQLLFSQSAADTHAELMDMDGRLLKDFSLNNTGATTLNLNSISAGMFFLKIYKSTNLIAVKKLAIVR